MTPSSLPRKVLKTNAFSTPRKRRIKNEANPSQREDVSTRPTTITSMIPAIFCTDSPLRPQNFRLFSTSEIHLGINLSSRHSFCIFSNEKIPISTGVKDEVLEIASKQDRNMRISTDRDLSRIAITKKSEEIARLQERIN